MVELSRCALDLECLKNCLSDMSVYVIAKENRALLEPTPPHPTPTLPYRLGGMYDRRALWFMIPHCVVGLMFVLAALMQGTTFLRYQFEGVTIDATVTKQTIDTRTARDGSRLEYSLSYTFVVVAQTYSGTQNVPFDLYQRYARGDVIPVRYVASDPWYSTLTEDDTIAFSALAAVGITVFWNGITYYFVYRITRNLRAHQALRSHGRVVVGEVIDCALWRQVLSLTVYLEFPATGEYITEKRQYRYRGDEADLPPKGASVAVLYLDDQTWEVL